MRFLAAARAKSHADWLMFLVSFHHGLRVSEVIHLTGNNVRGAYLDVQRLKGSERTVQPLVRHENPLLDEAGAVIELCRQRARNQRLFPISRATAWRRAQAYGKLAGIDPTKAHPHALKHSIATQTIEKAGINAVQKRLGHKSGSSTLMYMKLTDDEAARAVEGALAGLKD